jgi:hypothetical protein
VDPPQDEMSKRKTEKKKGFVVQYGQAFFLFPFLMYSLSFPIPVVDLSVLDIAFEFPIPVIDSIALDPVLQSPVLVIDPVLLDSSLGFPVPIINPAVFDPVLEVPIPVIDFEIFSRGYSGEEEESSQKE